MKLKDITLALEEAAPLAYQESYDNSGLICGDYAMDITGALICLDSTEQVLEEALQKGCNLVIAHHPILFSGIKKITGKNYVERVLIKAIRNNIAIYAAHTNADNVIHGVNARIAEKLGLGNCSILAPKKMLRKLVTFCPAAKADEVRQALFAAGAGRIGNYDSCSFNTPGTGTFRALGEANPYVGEKGTQHEEAEVRIESIYSLANEKQVLRHLFEAHPYEEVAYDIVPLENVHKEVGSGLVGDLEVEEDEVQFLQRLKQVLAAGCIRHTALRKEKVKKIAVCGGSGSFLLPEAIAAGADVFVTADFKYHQFFDADNKIVIADVGHYESEQFTPELFYGIVKKKFPTFAVHLAKTNTNPINYL